jgi:serine phosphatase RsbU (regulator of sigma subunit)
VRLIVRIAPLLMLAAVAAVELSDRRYVILDLAVLCPVLAAALAGPRLTAGYAALALLVAALLGIPENLYDGPGWERTAQAVRLGGVALGGLMAILASRTRVRRDRTLDDVRHVADVAQRAILAPLPRLPDGPRLAIRYESAAAQASVGGDLYEVVASPWGTRMLIGDVRGKGLEAVGAVSRVLGCFRFEAERVEDLGRVMTVLDAEVTKISGLEDFVTALLAQLAGMELILVNAGHPDPVLLRDDQAELLPVTTRQPPLGLGADGLNVTRVVLRAGDRLLFYTDGLAEARNPLTGEMLALVPAVRAAFTDAPLDDCLAALVRGVRRWTRSSLTDDVALLAVEITDGR